MGVPRSQVRNFCIIAHIDHGKSTLADRLLEMTGTISPRDMMAQVLDKMDLERERGITIKSHPVRMAYTALDGAVYELNLIDTPGHVDFTYEVSRSMAACEGAILVVDASQGVEAQTLANYVLALNHKLIVLPVLNKIDLPAADPPKVLDEVEDYLAIDRREAILASAKEGIGIREILEAVVAQVPPPQGAQDAPLRALIFDSQYDAYRGVVIYSRITEGAVRPGDRIRFMVKGGEFLVDEVGVFAPNMAPVEALVAGDVGYVIAGIRNIADARVGDTITLADRPAAEPLPGYRPVTPMVYCGLYPVDNMEYEELRDALEKLKLNDAALVYEPETSAALGFGFRCGFLGLLHMEIVQERLEREYDLELIATAPSVVYRVNTLRGEVLEIDNPDLLPDSALIDAIEEPVVTATVICPEEYVGAVMDLAHTRRGVFEDMQYHAEGRVVLTYCLPLNEIIFDFFDQLKSRTRGYASLDYELRGFQVAALVKLDIVVHGTRVDALSAICHRDKAETLARQLVERLKEVIPRQMFEIPIQAAIGNRVIARETVRGMRKNVIAKCYGGDITRKRKLLEKQKKGKKRMKAIGNVEIPQEAFLAVLTVGEP